MNTQSVVNVDPAANARPYYFHFIELHYFGNTFTWFHVLPWSLEWYFDFFGREEGCILCLFESLNPALLERLLSLVILLCTLPAQYLSS
jgi:hypothetical protein